MRQKYALMIMLVIMNILMACSSVPLSTMLKFSSFDEQNLITIKPSDIQAKITLNDFIDIDLVNTKLGLSLENTTGNLALQFPLEKLTLTQNSAKKGFLSDISASQTYLLQLSPEAIADFRRLQKQLQSSEKNSFGFSVNAKLKKHHELTKNQKITPLFITIELKLYKNEKFFTLIDQAEIKDGKSEL